MSSSSGVDPQSQLALVAERRAVPGLGRVEVGHREADVVEPAGIALSHGR